MKKAENNSQTENKDKIVVTDGAHPDFVYLAGLLDEYYFERFGADSIKYRPYNNPQTIHDVVVLYEDGKPVACGGFREFDGDTVEIKRLLVLPEHRRKGLAGRLMALLEGRAKEKGYTAIVLETGVVMDDALAFYRSMGYEKTESYGQYIGDEDCVCLRKSL
ncbi:GNAT family N-acetyltransferase [Christensenellaceae bacterium OttesenSCG-928-K19]|nr:GNAT family N-acetyltransferase [Christensenellaceae bacterium OttesenSCG-928-K19]